MLRSLATKPLRKVRPRGPRTLTSNLSCSASCSGSQQLNTPLQIDPSLQALLKDVDVALARNKTQSSPESAARRPLRELEALGEPFDESLDVTQDEHLEDEKEHRLSPAARFGRPRSAATILPVELQNSISMLIAESNKSQVHQDAKRLFYDGDGSSSSEARWDTSYDVKYRSYEQAARHRERDGLAFVSVALPAHYSVIRSVLEHTQRRLGPEWKVGRVVDFAAATGSALWASLHAFQKPPDPAKGIDADQPELSHSTVASYLGLDKRDGLVKIGKRLLEKAKLGSASCLWQKSFQEHDKVGRKNARDVLAISAFSLSALPSDLARKTAVKEMWESGADVMVIIDHDTPEGFAAVSEARAWLLKSGRKELDDPETVSWEARGSHVVAPCPHDGACPLYQPGSSKTFCGFSHRMQRPSFVRLTKHSGSGHEDNSYSYVVIRRGARPQAADTTSGRVGQVGLRAKVAEELKSTPMKELAIHDGTQSNESPAPEAAAPLDKSAEVDNSSISSPLTNDLEAKLRDEAWDWPRLVFPPIKNGGHIILDACTAQGKIMRMTIPKSQGKQPFYDARKSSWGDLFPHDPKNPAHERVLPKHPRRTRGPSQPAKVSKDSVNARGAGERRTSYDSIAKQIKQERRSQRGLARHEDLFED